MVLSQHSVLFNAQKLTLIEAQEDHWRMNEVVLEGYAGG